MLDLAAIHATQPDYQISDFLKAMRFSPDAERLFREVVVAGGTLNDVSSCAS